MRLRTQVSLAISVAAVIAATAFGLLSVAGARNAELAATRDAAADVSREVAGLLAVTQDYAAYRYERAARQWQTHHSNIGKMLEWDMTADLPEATPVIAAIKEHHSLLGELFAALTASMRGARDGDRAEARELLFRQLVSEAHELAQDAFRLGDAAQTASRISQQRVKVGTFTFGAVMVALFGGFVALIAWRVLRSVRALESITHAVREGDFDTRVAGAAARDEIGNLIRAFNAMLDTLRDTEGALRESEERFRRFFEAGLIGMAMSSTEKRLLEVNEAFCDMLGYAHDDLIGKNWSEITHPEDLPRNMALADRVATGEIDGYRLEKRYIRADRAIVQADVATRAVRHHDGSVRFMVNLIQDVTARKQAEIEVRQRTEELARSNRELEQFAYVASHDLQEPLRTVASFTQLLQRRYHGKLDATANEFIQHAVDGAARMRHLIEDLLAFSRVGIRGSRLEPVDAGNALASALANLQVVREQCQARIEVDALPTVLGDPTQLMQLFQNLVGNALKYRGEARPVVHVSARANGPIWQFTVADNGIGIAPEYHARIFNVFQRLHNRDRYPGTGIGLALCKKIVECHGGTIGVESAPGHGAKFWFTLRAAAAA